MTASNTTDSTAFDITDWLGEWESFEHYIDSDDAAIQQTWEAAEQAVLANPKMAPMAARGIRTFWSMACSTTSPENIIHIGYWRVNERPPNPAPRTMPRSPSNGSPRTTPASTPTNTPSTMSSSTVSKAPHLRVPHHRSGRRRQPVPLATCHQSAAFAQGVRRGRLLSHLHFQYANDLHTLVATDEATGVETLRNPLGTPPCAPTREPSRTVAPSSARCTTCSRPSNIRQ